MVGFKHVTRYVYLGGQEFNVSICNISVVYSKHVLIVVQMSAATIAPQCCTAVED